MEQTNYRPAPRVYQAISNVTEALSKDGISKSRKNQQQNYQFRGIDDIYNALASELAKNKLCVLPVVLERTCEERATKSGGALFYVNVRVQFDFVCAEDGSSHRVVTLGEAMDSNDKATNKAMSAAYKYAALMTFCIPTEGDNDSENHNHEVAPRQSYTHQPQPKPPTPPAAKPPEAKPGDFWQQKKMIIPFPTKHLPGADGQYTPEALAHWKANFTKGIEAAPSRATLAQYQADNQHIIDLFPAAETQAMCDACSARAEKLTS